MRSARLFGTNGIRGIAGTTIDSNFAYRIGSSVASTYKSKRVLVGRDGRMSSPMLAEGVIAGLLAHGNEVEDCGEITTPGLQFLVKLSSNTAGVMVTASHNPSEYNGFKVVDTDGIEIARGKEEQIEYLFARNSSRLTKNPGKRTSPPHPLEPYLSGLMKHVEEGSVKKNTTVVVDTGNGVAGLTTPVLLRRIGCKVITINDNIDGRFPGRTSEPKPENLGPLAAVVRQEKAAFGVAHDGDGDRAMFVDETGTVHSGDESLSLIEDETLKKNPGGTVVTPVNSSMSVAETARRRHGKLVLTPVGSIHVARTMVKNKAVLGGEENGGIFYAPHQPVRDGAIATVLILNAVLRNRLTLSRLMARLPRFFMAKEKYQCPDDRKAIAIRKIRDRLGKRVTSTIDGVRVDLNNKGWFLVRASGTEPLIRFYAEGRTENNLKAIINEFGPVVARAVGT